MADLQMAATKKICSGELTEEELQNFIIAGSASGKGVICTIDVLADGRFRKHSTTETEVLEFACRSDDYEQLLEAIASRREEYLEQVARAKNARDKRQQQKA